jgi:hypothetical protein
MITTADLQSVLADCSAMGLPRELDEDTPIVIDSLAAAWIQHMLAERHGLQVILTPDAVRSVGSVQELHELVTRTAGQGGG